ncbi:DUF6544 family protein [Nocardioides jishulii]|uniref:Uncharacterized protein n=1 Tax=Nocardioides jishulii TaxID=2575440 RepID=A0A4U2YKK8_9ACTN|nr:DUF6544 family protein [Nocardioides jishulii]QCX26967.1 hypothetical protein FCL41_05055 [Nocardioides jishulii]TKI61450.1 hypothetical protein FC770_11690 [Nocardioides jishulii]
MENVVRWTVVVVLTVHGLIHLLGVAKGFGWADVPQLKAPIGTRSGLLWLLAAALVLTAAVLLAVGAPTWWWLVAAAAAVVSQIAIVTSWEDAKAGTVLNVLLAVVAAYGFVSVGPPSFHARWDRQASEALTDVDAAPPVLLEEDLSGLPEPLATYVRRSGAVGKPRVTSLYAHFHGRIRSGPEAAWMPFTGQQVNTFGERPRRLFLMDATRSGLPVTVLHEYADATAAMRGRVLSLVTVVDASGEVMDRGETVTVFNELVVLAPGAIVDAPVRWTSLDARRVRGDFTLGDQTVSAELVFDADGDLADFVSEDRSRASEDGKSFVRQTWSTPLSGYRDSDGRRLLTSGEGRWKDPKGWFAYIELEFDAIDYNVRSLEAAGG